MSMVTPSHEQRDTTAAIAAALGLGLALLGCDPGGGTDSGMSPGGTTGGSESTAGQSGTINPDPDPGETESPQDSSGGTPDPSDTDGNTSTGEPPDDPATTTGIPGEPGPDLREQGPYAVLESSATAALGTGCSMSYDLRRPEGLDDAPTVVLAHGFMGNRASMAGWAEHFASWGLEVIAPDLCHATIIDADHPQNAVDLQALVAELGVGPVVYAGYSAGGLAAVLAAADDPSALAVLGLDMVDSDGLGAAASPNIMAPAYNIAGEPSMCNSSSNGTPVFLASAQGNALRVTESDHCDFQSPADFLCGLTCNGTNTTFDDDTIQAAVRGLSTAALVWHADLDPSGAQWWTPGEHYYELLFGTGILQVP